MKKRVLSMVCALILLAGLTGVTSMQAEAEEERQQIDGSYLITEQESIGYDTKITRGQYLLTGYSKSVRLGPGLLYAGGSTIATQDVDRIGIGVIVERAQEGDDHWTIYESWQKFLSNTDRVMSNARMEVEGGYYYRVRCTHSAANDVSSSFTDGVFIEEPSIFN